MTRLDRTAVTLQPNADCFRDDAEKPILDFFWKRLARAPGAVGFYP